jgi:hypothetical protein
MARFSAAIIGLFQLSNPGFSPMAAFNSQYLRNSTSPGRRKIVAAEIAGPYFTVGPVRYSLQFPACAGLKNLWEQSAVIRPGAPDCPARSAGLARIFKREYFRRFRLIGRSGTGPAIRRKKTAIAKADDGFFEFWLRGQDLNL